MLKGIRRSGKSTIMKQLAEELLTQGVDPKQTVFLNLEDYRLPSNLDPEFLAQVLKVYLAFTKNKERVYFFIDEAQRVVGWERWVRTLYDQGANIKCIISGSSASLLSQELATLLTGRNLSFTIFPLSFQEYCSFHFQSSSQLLLDEYLAFGGFPEVALEPLLENKKKILEQYFSDILFKDIIDRHNIRNVKQLGDLARYIMSNSGAKVSYRKLSHVFGISDDTLKLYVSYMIDAFLVWEVPFFSFSKKTQHAVSSLPKLYAIDNGLITINCQKKNKGCLFESVILGNLLRQKHTPSYWTDGATEVDFITSSTALNVTSVEEPPPREYAGLHAFLTKNKTFRRVLVAQKTSPNTISLLDFLST